MKFGLRANIFFEKTGSSISQRDPEVVFWPSDLLEAWGIKPQKHKFPRKSKLFGLAAFGDKGQQKHIVLEHVFFGLGTPGLQKNTCPNNHFGIPLYID